MLQALVLGGMAIVLRNDLARDISRRPVWAATEVLRALAVFVIGLTLPTDNQAFAKELCVTCEQPKMNYRCRVPEIDIGRATDAAAKYVCITELAKHGRHSACQVKRQPQGFSCLGHLRVIGTDGKILKGDGQKAERPPPAGVTPDAPGQAVTPDVAGNTANKVEPPATAGSAQNSDGQVPAQADTTGPDQKEVAKPDDQGPPKTVEELAKLTAEQSGKGLQTAGKQIKEAGDAVSNIAKKTWNCVASLFFDC